MQERNRIIEEHYRKNFSTYKRQFRKFGHLAEDIVQQGYTDALQYWDTYDAEKGELAPWITSIMMSARNRVLKDARKYG